MPNPRLMVEGATAAERTEAGLRDSTDLAQVDQILRELENDFEEPVTEHEVDNALKKVMEMGAPPM